MPPDSRERGGFDVDMCLAGRSLLYHHFFESREIRLCRQSGFLCVGMTHGAEDAGQLGKEGFVFVQTAGVEQPHKLFAVGQAGGKGGVHAAAADEAGRFHEKLHMGLYIRFRITVAQSSTGNREYAFEADDLGRLDDQRAGAHDRRNEQEAGADLVGHIGDGLSGRKRAHSRAAAVYCFQYASSGKGTEGRSECGTIDRIFFGQETLGGQTFEQLPAAFKESLLQLLFYLFLFVHVEFRHIILNEAPFLFLLCIGKINKAF